MAPGKVPAINAFQQFLALLYKELLLRKCHYIATSFEIIFPILIISIPCIMYQEPEKSEREKFKWVNFTTFNPVEAKKLYGGVSTDDLEFVYAPTNAVADQFMVDSLLSFFGSEYRYYHKIPKNLNSEEELTNGEFKTRQKYELDGPVTYTEYRYSFFTRWQAAVGETFIRKKSTEYRSAVDYKLFLQLFPYPEHKDAFFGLHFLFQHELFLHIGFMFFVVAVVKRIIDEKNDGSKELMETMGMTKSTFWTSTFVNNFIVGFILTLVITTLYKTTAKGTSFYLQTDFILLFIIILLFIANLILFCMTFSIFFNRVAYAVCALMIVYLLSFQLLMWEIYSDTFEGYFASSLFHKLMICVYPSGALITSFVIINIFEGGNEGIQWRNLTEYPSIPDINMLMVIIMMAFSCFFYIVAIWYFDTVWPWQPRVHKPFYFFLTKSYWFGQNTNVPTEIELVRSEKADNFEEESSSSVKTVVIKDLSKVIQQGNSSKTVLHDISIKCNQGQITVLLGHSEAGKTSIINILSGKELPTAGIAAINGFDVSTNTTRQFLGFCPQHNVLYDGISVEQHLKIFAAMKGTSLKGLTYEAEQTLDILKLTNKKTERVSNLSYTDKRKLCLAIAIVADSKVLLLDEPTYGMNNESKRQVWDALQAVKHNRTVIVATQSFEEADILGDRIAVLADGEIHSCGTSAFIKQKLGAGYHLHVLKDVNFDLQGLKSIIRKHISTVTCENDSQREISFNLGASNEFGDMLGEIDSHKNDLGLISYSISSSTIRDVSLTVSNMSGTIQNLPPGGAIEITSTDTEDATRDSFHPTLHASVHNQFRALLLKHFHLCKRRWKFHLIQLTIPFIMMLMCFYCMNDLHKTPNPPLELDISSVYGSTDGFYYYEDPSLSNIAETFKNVLESKKVGTEKVTEPTHYVLNYGKKSFAKYLKRLIVGGTFDRLQSGALNLTAWYNAGAVHALPMSLLLMQTTLLRHIASTGSISLTLVPIISLRERYSSLSDVGLTSSGWATFYVPLVCTFLSLSFILMHVHERATKAKLLQLMSGIPTAMYWIAIFLWDYFIYFVICLIMIMPPAFFFPSVFFGAHWNAIGSFLLLLFLYGWASLPLGYIVTIFLKRENRGIAIFIGICAFFGVVMQTLLQNIIFLLLREGKDVYGVPDSYWFFRLFPTYSISMGVMQNFQIAFNNVACDLFTKEDLTQCKSSSIDSVLNRCCKDACYTHDCHTTMKHLSWISNKSPYANGPEALYLGVEGFIFFVILFLLETRTATRFLNIIEFHLQTTWNRIVRVIFRRAARQVVLSGGIEDSLVIQEEERIRNLTATQQGSGSQALVVLELTKKLGTSFAANRLTFGVNAEECFGILGDIEAGKTSIFRILTGDDLPSEGNAFIQSYALKGNFRKFQSHIGYCPEMNPLMDDLTGRETLLLYGQLRGLFGFELHNRVKELIQSIGLINCADVPTQFYSGGDKRKLSVATALIGSPPLILLDEPSLGANPESRRQIWKVLTREKKRTGATVLFATQNLEEAKGFLYLSGHYMFNGFRFSRCLGQTESSKNLKVAKDIL
ncbi:ATP-binding cassette sub-family A member 1 like protein [Argiope bruennichi]|uniref:ATP-binding cassette sub-family A member 1 like protein n=1 Tax=Argiope bruennichi TaxID=94029 RepID=A0A8T0E539_ARGBR|nr:ATP-binding cassette sub-family A member 1 like protein [Argiope bruennichi]